MSSSSVQVVVRLRPMNEKEKKHGTLPVIKAQTQEKSVTVIKGQGPRQARSNYNFDNVFTAFSSQQEVFDATLKPVIRDVMQGYESTVFAYGQTGTGKTYTMEGNLSSPEHYGIIPRSAQAIFEALKKPEFTSYNVVCTYLEIYNEELGDLLADDPLISHHSSSTTTSSSTPMKERPMSRSSYATSSHTPMKDRTNTSQHINKKLEIMNGKNGTFCRGLTERQVNSASDVFELMQRAQQLRKIGETKMNKESSRSHCVFSIIIHANRRLNDGSTFEFSGKLHMVDLAGSECAKTAGLDRPSASDVARERERKNINQSLLTLGRVIKTLKEQSTSNKKSNIRIPYRDSKLTRILQESLGGRCKTLIIATLSPSVTAIEESMSTLSYAQEANGIVNKPVSSSYLSLSSSSAPSNIETAGSSDPNSVEHWQEMECRLEYMQTQVEEAKAALARKHMQQQELVERAEKAELAANKFENELFTAKSEVTQLKENVVKEKEEKEALKNSLKKTEVTLQKTNAILQATQHTEVCLTSEAKAILDSLEKSINDGNDLYTLLSDARNEDIKKRHATKMLHTTMESTLNQIQVQMDNLIQNHQDYQQTITNNISQSKVDEERFFSSQSMLLQERNKNINSFCKEIHSISQDDGGIKTSLTNLSNSTSVQIRETLDLINEAKNALRGAIEVTKGQVNDLSQNLEEGNSDYLKKSENVLKLFESNVGSLKMRLEEMSTTVLQGLGEVLNATSISRKELTAALANIEDALEHNLASTVKMTCDQSQTMSKNLVEFREGKKDLVEARSLLEGQKTFMAEHESNHLKEVERLKSMVSSQRVIIEKAYTDQRKLQEQFLSNAFTRMQQLLQEEMTTMYDFTEKQKISLEASHGDILSQNNNVNSSAEAIFSNLKQNNGKLAVNLQAVEANEKSLEEAVDNTIHGFTTIEMLAREGKSTIEKHVASSMNHVHMLNTQEEKMNEINNAILKNECSIQEAIDNNLLAQTTADICEMKTEGSKHINGANDTVSSIIDSAIQKIEEPQVQISTNLVAHLETMKNGMHTAVVGIHPIINDQLKKVQEINEALTEHEEEFNQATSTYKNATVNKNQSMIVSTEKLNTNTSTCTGKSKSFVSDAKSTLVTFSQHQIRAEEDVDPLTERTRYEYSEHFTSTPADDIIIKELDLSESDEIRSDSMKSDISCSTTTAEISSSQESSPSDDTHISSSCSERKPSPLIELSINKENICDNVSKKQSDALVKPRRNKGKKRSHSRQPTEYRKRIQLTPSNRGNSRNSRNGHSR